MKSEEISRRSFLKRALALSAVSAIPSFWTPAHGRVLPTSPLISANDRVNIAFIGIGQRGGEIAKELYNTGLCNVVALCDVDMGAPHTQEIINMFPKAARFQDFRTMFDRMADKIDAVSVGVPDHSHFPITIEAMASPMLQPNRWLAAMPASAAQADSRLLQTRPMSQPAFNAA